MSKKEQRKFRGRIDYMYSLVLLAVFVALLLFYALMHEGNAVADLTGFLADLSVGLASIAIAGWGFYWFIRRPGLHNPFSVDEASSAKFIDSFQDVNWEELFSTSTQIDVVVCYYDSWVQQNRDILRNYFSKGGKINIFLGDPKNDKVFQTTLDRFPEYRDRPEELKVKISATYSRLKQYADENSEGQDLVKGYYIDQSPNYSAFVFGNSRVLVSVYEQFRDKRKKIQAPAFIINQSKSPHSVHFWSKEINQFLKQGRKIPQ